MKKYSRMRGKKAQCKDSETEHTSEIYIMQNSGNQLIEHFDILKRM